jgi:hypothetical protein
MEDTIQMPSQSQQTTNSETQFKNLLKQINDRYGDHIKGLETDQVSKTEVNAFIDKLANETKLDMPDSEPNPQGDYFF